MRKLKGENKMSKILMVYEYVMCEHVEHGVFLDVEKGREYIKEKNIPHNEIQKLVSECWECHEENYDDEVSVFKSRYTCPRSCIKTDRNGEYCENHVSECGNPHSSFSGVEMETMD